MKYKAYLFDFDYTLVDSSVGIVKCYSNVLTAHQYKVDEKAIKATIGKTLEESFSILTGLTDPDVLQQLRSEYVKEADIHMNVNTKFYNDVIPTLKELKRCGVKLGIISTKYSYRIKEFLKDHLPEDFFDVVLGVNDVEQPKPSPEGLKKALKMLGVSNKEALYVGDSIVDIQTAHAAKVHFLGVLTGVTTAKDFSKENAHALVNSFHDLLEIENVYRQKKDHRIVRFFNYKKIKRYFKFKRKSGYQIMRYYPGVTYCLNCGNTYKGNFCNVCGQDRKTHRYNTGSILNNLILGVTNIDNGFGYTLVDLLLRPGYMIKDFIGGKRKQYFRPFQMLFILAAVYIVLVQIINPKSYDRNYQKAIDQHQELVAVFSDFKNNLDFDASHGEFHLSLNSDDPKIKVQSSTDSIADDSVALQESTSYNDSTFDRHFFDEDEVTLEKKKIKSSLKDATQIALNGVDSLDSAQPTASASSTVEKTIFKSPFLSSVEKLLVRWSHGNKAASILCLIPILAIATRMSHRHRKRSKKRHPVVANYNITEHIFIQTYLACLMLWASILYLPFTVKIDFTSMYGIPYWMVFLLYIYVYHDLFSYGWFKSFRKVLLMFFYSLFIIILGAIILVALFIWVSYLDSLFTKV